MVLFAGGGGLLLLMHPVSTQAAAKTLNKVFIVTSSSIIRFSIPRRIVDSGR